MTESRIILGIMQLAGAKILKIMNRKHQLFIFFVLNFLAVSSFAQKPGFWQERYRGWLWFEEKEQEEPETKPSESREFTIEEMEDIKAKNEQFAKNLIC